MNRSRILALVVLVAVAIGLATVLRSDEGQESWLEMQRRLSAAEVTSVEVAGPGRNKEILSTAEVDQFVEAFLSGSFLGDSPRNYGPTAQILVLYTLKDGEPIPASQWPDGHFEISQGSDKFLIEAPQLARMLEERGFVYE